MLARQVPLSILTLALGALIVTLLAISVSTGASQGFDRAVIEMVRSEGTRTFFSPMRRITELGSTEAVSLVAGITLLVGVLVGPWRHGAIGALTIALASVGNQGLKAFVARSRPDVLEPIVVEHGFSFPSGHAILSMVAYGVLGVLIMRSRLPLPLRRTIAGILGVLILVIGISRVWLGVHFPTDVLAGWTAGAVIVLVYARLTRSVSPEPAAAALDADPAGPRSDRPAPG